MREIIRGPETGLAFVDCTADFDDVAVAVGNKPGMPPLLYASVGRRWLKPLPVEGAAMLASIARVDDERWLVVGRKTEGEAFAASYWPLNWELERIYTPPSRALLACAGRPERREAIAVGAAGLVVRFQRDELSAATVPSEPDFSAVAIDTLGRKWAGSPACLWTEFDNEELQIAWSDLTWHAPFVSLMAEVGVVFAMTVDGAVVEGHADPAGYRVEQISAY
jgi:hypothetical protein